MTPEQIVFERAQSRPEVTALRVADRKGWQPWTWQTLWGKTAQRAAGLRAAGVRAGDTVMLLVPEVEHNVPILFAVWTLGATPVQMGLPYRLTDVGAFLTHLRAVAAKVDARALVVGPMLASFAKADASDIPVIAADALEGEGAVEAPVGGDAPALIQLTSGSVSSPKGVVISREKLMGHLASIHAALPPSEATEEVSWLPLYHDMGLIGGLLYPLTADVVLNLMSPLDFRNSPYRWLQRMSEVGASHTAAPPSAFAVAARLGGRAQADGLDLSAIRCAMVGAEPIPARVLRAFTDAFAPCGFRGEAFFPVYGLAETTVAVTFPDVMVPTTFDRVDRHALAKVGKAEPVPAGGVEFTGVGRAIPGSAIRVVDADLQDLPERQVGQILVRTSTGMEGYFDDPESTAAAFHGDWLLTGDLGYLADGQLFVTGRLKELIIRAGENLTPSVIEDVASEVPGVRRGCVAAVGVPSVQRGTERAVVVAETTVPDDDRPAIADALRAHLAAHGLEVDDIRLVAKGTLPKTTSGKIQRRAIARDLADGAL